MITFNTCKGQAKGETISEENLNIGKVVSELDSKIWKIFQDSKGNIWFGTFVAGAFRYDGKSFLWFDEKELSILPDGTAPGVQSIIQDKDGCFWFSNFKNKYKIEANTSAYKKLTGIEKDKPNYFNSGLSDNNGDLWMTTYNGEVSGSMMGK